jgi:putative peptidoglycan lipid II flippase
MTHQPPAESTDESRILSSSAVMAAGTVVSRLSGFVRSALLVAALGNVLHADLFNIGNTVPNMLYILVAGGIFNAVLVPQLVRSMRNDADGGEAYTNRVVTAAVLFLGLVTLLLVLAAPWVMSLYLDPSFDDPSLATQRESVIDFARYCLPQVFFYGVFVLLGQILNSRGRFGPMMWAPIANNVIAVGVLVIYLVVFGPATEAEQTAGFTSGQEALLGLGSTVGIAAQLLILLPFLKSAGFRFRPRFDLKDTGLGHTLRLGVWTVLFVVVNQIAYTVVVRLASGGTAAAVDGGTGTGYTVYAQSFLIVMVPHAVITVSLATAILPRLSDRANVGDLGGVARTLSLSLRSALAVILPFALLLPLVAPDVAHVVWGWGAGRDEFELFTPTLSLFGVGLLFFTVHYLTLRGFYALERNRTVFWIQCVIAITNIAAAVALVSLATAEQTSPALVLAYIASYAVGSTLSYLVLRRLLGGLETPRLARFLLRLLIAAGISTVVAYLATVALDQLGSPSNQALAALRGVTITALDVLVFVVVARLLHLREVTDVLDTVTRRLRSRTHA